MHNPPEMDSVNIFLYILLSEALNRYYVGVSRNPQRRLNYHNTANKGWTRRGRSWNLIFQRRFSDKQEAYRWERWIKRQKSRSSIQRIISSEFDWRW